MTQPFTVEENAALDRWCAMSEAEFDQWIESVWADAVATNEINSLYRDLGGES